MDKLIREALDARAREVTVPPGAWERQEAMLEAGRAGRALARRPGGRFLRELAALAVVGALLAVALVGGLGLPRRDGGGGAPPPGESTPAQGGGAGAAGGGRPETAGGDGPEIRPAAFQGLGRLAFVRDGRLYILDGETGSLRTVEADTASAPRWSADGSWLAFWQGEGEGRRLLVVDAAAGQARAVVGLPGTVTGYAWAPEGAAMAVAVRSGGQPESGADSSAAAPAAHGIWLVPDPARPEPRLLATVERPSGGLSWSPDGSRIAYLITLPFTDPETRSGALEIVPAAGGAPERWYVAEGSGIEVAGWWPDGGGLLFWPRYLHANSLAADGMPLQSLAVGSREPVALPLMLLYESWLAWGPGGRELLLVRGGGRPVWDGKGLAACDVANGQCRDLPQPDDIVYLDPAWSPDGSRIAFVAAQRRPGEMGFDSEVGVKEWVGSRTLWVAGPDGSGARELTAAGRGVYGPAWAADGRRLLYIRDGALLVLDLEREQEELVARLGEPGAQFGFYGHVNGWWGVAWHRGERP